jgi:hypothetical protein
MYLESGGLSFHIQVIDQEWDDDIAIYCGQYRKPPCVIILFERGSTIARLQSVGFFEHCSVSNSKQFTRRSGAVVVMVKVVLQWITNTYNISTVVFADESHSAQGYMLPEKMVLTEGQTWYQKYFTAEPEETRTKPALKAYVKLYNEKKEYFRTLDDGMWLVENVRDVLAPFQTTLQYQQLTSSSWYIKATTIKGYNIAFTVHTDILGGSMKKKALRQQRTVTPVLWKHVVEL